MNIALMLIIDQAFTDNYFSCVQKSSSPSFNGMISSFALTQHCRDE
jgi:hypothetical protein